MHLKLENQTIYQWYASNFFITILLFCAINTQVRGQIEPQLGKYPERAHDSLYYELFKTHRESNTYLAQTYAAKSLELSKKHDHIEIILKSLNALGFLYGAKNNYDSALFYHTEALDYAVKHNRIDRAMYSYCNLGILYLNVGLIDRSLDYSLKALKLSRELEQVDVEISTLNNIALAYVKIDDNEEALSYYKEAMKISSKSGIPFKSNASVNVAFTYINLKKYPEALDIFNKILETGSSDKFKIDAYFGLATIHLKKSNLMASSQYAQMAMELSQEANDYQYIVGSYRILGEIAYAKKDYNNAINNLKKGLALAEEIKSLDAQQELYLLLSSVYFDNDDFKNSSLNREHAYILKDSLFNQRFAKNFKNIHLKVAKEKSDGIIQTKEERIEHQQKSVIVAGIVTIVALLMVAFFWRASYLMRRSRDMQTEANKLIQKQNKDLERFGNVVEKLMEDRILELREVKNTLSKNSNHLDNFIFKFSQDVRVPLANLRTITSMGLSSTKDPVARRYFAELENVAESFSLVFNLFLVLDDIDRAPAVYVKIHFEELIEEIIETQRRKGIPEKIEFEILVAPLINFHSDLRSMKLVLSTLITNAIKFYDPSESVHSIIDIKVYQQNGSVKINVTDNGIGIDDAMKNALFQVPNIFSASGVSLHLTKRACDRLSGGIQFAKTPQGYTEFVVTLPTPKSIAKPANLN